LVDCLYAADNFVVYVDSYRHGHILQELER
jgi:hypothetical protein